MALPSTILIGLLVLVYVLISPADGLVIYRFGGPDVPPPKETGEVGVDFVQWDWTDFDPTLGGEALDLDLKPDAIASLRRDPAVNLAPTAEEEGGVYIEPPLNDQVWDGDPTTVWKATPYLCGQLLAYYLTCNDDFSNLGTANINLGSLYEIDRIRIVSGLRNPGATVQGLRVFLGPPVTDRFYDPPPPFSPWVVEIRDNRQQVLDIPMPPNRGTGFVQIALQEHTLPWEVHDIHVYARGFASQSTYMSTIFDFDRPMAYGPLRWNGEKGDQAKVQIQTRSGLDDDPVSYWRYIGRGVDKTQVSAAGYGELSPGERAGTGYDRGNWSFWSTYEFGDSLGTQIVSPSPRRYFQFRVDFLPRDDDGGVVEFLEFRVSEPVATDLVAEVWPAEARTGEWTDFTYVLLPTIGVEDPGFDRLEIRSESLLGPVSGVQVGDTDVAYTVEAAEPHRLVLAFPPLQPSDSGALVEVDFEAKVRRYGARFEGRVWHSTRPIDVPQAANDGDATGDYEANRVSVATAERNRLLLRMDEAVRVVTPNGDGLNDEAVFTFELFEITGQASVRVEVVDLSGRRVRVVDDGDRGIGVYEFPWDARDDRGLIVPPGLYVGRVRVQTDGSKVEKVRVLYVAY